MGLGATPFHILVCTSLQVPTTGTRIKYPWPGCSSILVRHLEQRGPGCRASSSAWATWLPGCKLLGTAATCPLPCTGSIKRSRKRSCSPPPGPLPSPCTETKQGHTCAEAGALGTPAVCSALPCKHAGQYAPALPRTCFVTYYAAVFARDTWISGVA